MNHSLTARLRCCLALLSLAGIAAHAQSAGDGQGAVDGRYYQDLSYRLIGPFRGGRTVGAVGVPSQPNVFYIGVNNGGVWKTDDYGHSWKPIFDQAATGSVGDIAVSPSDPQVIYVGSGEGLHRPDLSTGDGIFKSVDGGASWQHVGLPDVQQVGRIIVHPADPDIVFVAGLGHPYGPNEERGVFRSSDGGASWEKVLYIDENTGAIQVEFSAADPDTLFASLWEHREGPWENAKFSGPNSGLYKSTDGGDSWRPIRGGLPGASQGLGRIGVGIAPGNPRRLYATVDATDGGGVYRSEDGGESWQRISDDERIWGRGGDFAEIRVHPRDEDVVFAGNIASYRSDDGGASWTSIKGAPGGDDYHRIWINPEQPDIMIFAADQGATVTINGGRTWSSWYNQPTAQLYHVSTDNQFPYWIYGGQQESGAIGIASRGNGGQISFRDWIGVGADEYAYVVADPLNPDIVYGGRVVRFDRRTGQALTLRAPAAACTRAAQRRIRPTQSRIRRNSHRVPSDDSRPTTPGTHLRRSRGPHHIRFHRDRPRLDFLSVDDGLSVTFGGALTCDPARWGHLEVFAAAVLSVDSLAALGARFGTAWETSHRSGWRIELTTDLARHELRIGRGLRVF